MMKFLLKGLIRDRTRSLFPILMVGTGAFMTVILYSWMQGVIGDMVRTHAQFSTGHVKIITQAYKKLADQTPNDLALLEIDTLLEQLRTNEKEMIWTPRIRFGGLLDIPDEHGETRSQGPVMGMGVDLLNPESSEIKILNLSKALIQGRLPQEENEILLSEGLAQKLEVSIGETATLLSSTMYGSMSMHNFKVAGTIRFGITALDKEAIIADLKDIQSALDMADGASEILGYSKDMVYANNVMSAVAKKFNEKFHEENDEFSPIMLSLGEQNSLADLLYWSKMAGGIIVLIFVTAMSIVLWNAALMSNLRRYGEIGVRLAMGEHKGNLYRRMIFESIITGTLGSILGTILGLAISYYLQNTGIDIGGMLQKSSMIISNEMRARVTTVSYFIGFIPGLFASVLGTMFAGVGIYRRQTSQLFKELEI